MSELPSACETQELADELIDFNFSPHVILALTVQLKDVRLKVNDPEMHSYISHHTECIFV